MHPPIHCLIQYTVLKKAHQASQIIGIKQRISLSVQQSKINGGSEEPLSARQVQYLGQRASSE